SGRPTSGRGARSRAAPVSSAPAREPGVSAAGWRGAASFLTVVGKGSSPDPRAFEWFPVIGALLGAALGTIWWAAGHAFPALAVAALVVGADLGLTGLLHFDGLVDSA